MNIAYITPVVYPFVKGGAEKRIHEIGRRLAERGHDITIYSRHWWDGPDVRTHAGMTLRAVGPSCEIYGKGGRRSITNSIAFTVHTVKTAVRPEEIDLYVTPAMAYLHVFATSFVSKIRRTPLIVTWHEAWGDHWYRYMGRGGGIGKGVERLCAALPQHPVAPSATTARKLRDILGMKREIPVIPNGIDVEHVRHITPSDDGFDALYAGRLIEDKNVRLLIDAFNRLETDATLGIIGDGPQFDALQTHTATLDCADRVKFCGFLDTYDEVLAQMRAARVFVSPSIREGFGMTLLEAMAADCTVITANHPNSAGSEVVGKAGFIPTPSVDAVASDLERALSGERPIVDPVTAAKSYNWDQITSQTENYYQGVVNDTETQ